MSERQQRIRLGLFVLITLALLGGLVLFFGGAPKFFQRSNEYVILFSDAPGLAPGTPVRKSGVKIGEVRSIELDDRTGQVQVVVRLDPKFTPRTSDEPTVTRGLLVGDTAIDFIPKTDKPIVGDAISPGSIIEGVSPFNAKLLIDQATSTVPEAQRTMEQVRRSLETIEKMMPQIQTTLKEVGDLAKAGREFLPEIRRANDNLKDLFGSNDLIPELKKTNDEIRYFLKTTSFWVEEAGVMLKKNEPRIAKALDAFTNTTEKIGELFTPENQKMYMEILNNINNASARLDKLAMGAEDLMKDGRATMKTFSSAMAQAEQAIMEVRQMTRPLSERMPKILENIDNGSDQFTKTMQDAREIVKAIGRSEGSFQRFIADPALYNNLNETTIMLNKLMPRLDRILKDVEVFADKIARHPEALGIGGAIRPSAGLKEAPSPSPSTPAYKLRTP